MICDTHTRIIDTDIIFDPFKSRMICENRFRSTPYPE